MYTKGMENKVEPTPGASSRDPSALTTSSSPSNRLVDIPFAPLFAYGRLSYQTQAAAEKMKDVGEGWNVNEYVFGLSVSDSSNSLMRMSIGDVGLAGDRSAMLWY